MVRAFIKFGLINTLCIMNLVAVLLLVHQWFTIKPTLFKTITIAMIVLGLLSTVLMSLIPNNSVLYKKTVNVLEKVSFVVFWICAISAQVNIYRFGIERGTELYHLYSFPVALPIISGVILGCIKINIEQQN